ncbi:MAG: hypothetical protein ACI80F_000445, partial [Natronomonas sp.]|uniref:DUF7139 domain-containing protein n=1 Tax=Natronomonas sp. TaxID=2184060 RepID=UPI00398A4E78
LGFALVFGGLGLGILGLFLFIIERGVLAGELFWLREVAFVAGALGLPVVLVSVVVLLPADRRATYVAGGGLAITIAALAFFVAVYPSNWNHGTPDYSLQGVSIYAIGVVSVLAATGSALVGYHIERAQGVPAGGAASAPTPDDDASSSADPAATEARVQQDIEAAMSDTEISWGGVEKVETGQLNITPDAELDGEELDQSSATVHRSKSVDDQLSALQGMKGGEERTDSGSGVDDQAMALKELREQQKAEADEEDGSLVDRLKSLAGRGE